MVGIGSFVAALVITALAWAFDVTTGWWLVLVFFGAWFVVYVLATSGAFGDAIADGDWGSDSCGSGGGDSCGSGSGD
jgi:hypothetical protein